MKQFGVWRIIQKHKQKGPNNDMKRKTIGQNLPQFYHLQFDVVETCQSRPLELTDYCA